MSRFVPLVLACALVLGIAMPARAQDGVEGEEIVVASGPAVEVVELKHNAVRTYAPPTQPPIPGATRIWTDYLVDDPAEFGPFTFRQTFTLPAQLEESRGSITIQVDDTYALTVNGKPIAADATGEFWYTERTFDITPALLPGRENVIEVRAANICFDTAGCGADPYNNAAGVTYKAVIDSNRPDEEVSERSAEATETFKLTLLGTPERDAAAFTLWVTPEKGEPVDAAFCSAAGSVPCVGNGQVRTHSVTLPTGTRVRFSYERGIRGAPAEPFYAGDLTIDGDRVTSAWVDLSTGDYGAGNGPAQVGTGPRDAGREATALVSPAGEVLSPAIGQDGRRQEAGEERAVRHQDERLGTLSSEKRAGGAAARGERVRTIQVEAIPKLLPATGAGAQRSPDAHSG